MIQKVDGDKILIASMRRESYLPLAHPQTFDVGFGSDVEVCRGDKILILANRKKLGLINGQVLTVENVQNRSILTKEGVIVPENFKQWTHGYAVTSQKAEGRTSEHVVLAAARVDAKILYVSCSRGRQSCVIHTPDKAALIERLPEGNRKAALDVLDVVPKERSPLLERPKAWEKAKSRTARAQAARRADLMQQAVQRWYGERHLFRELQAKMEGPTRPPGYSMNHDAVHSINRRANDRGISL